MVANCPPSVRLQWTDCDMRSFFAVPVRVAALLLPCTGNRTYRSVVSLCAITVAFVFLLFLLIQHQLQELDEVRTKLGKLMAGMIYCLYNSMRRKFYRTYIYIIVCMMLT